MDFPGAVLLKPTISTISTPTLGASLGATFSGAPVSAAIPASNNAYFVPLVLPVPFLLKTVWWTNGGTAAGSLDCGVYTAGGTLLASCGSTVQVGTNVVQSVALGTPVLLQPGSYYMALAASLNTTTVFRIPVGLRFVQIVGVAQQGTAFPLPATFTLASLANNFLPIFGISNASVI